MTYISAAPTNRHLVQESTPAPIGSIASAHFDTLETQIEADTASFWAFTRSGPKPCYTPELLDDLLSMQAQLRDALSRERDDPAALRLRYFVFGSRLPGIFNLGGDLDLFARCIEGGHRQELRRYGHRCVEAVHGNAEALRAPIVTIALVQGDALGGGFECALAFDVIVAERRARFGLPEILFNMFPGMGAYSFLSRRLGPIQAERLITSGKIHTAEELHAMGLVDVLAEDGEGEAAVRAYIERQGKRHNAHQALMQVRRRVNPVTLAELKDVVDIWTDTALGVSDLDLRMMRRLAGAQQKRIAANGADVSGRLPEEAPALQRA
jgi:DSF synthase